MAPGKMPYVRHPTLPGWPALRQEVAGIHHRHPSRRIDDVVLQVRQVRAADEHDFETVPRQEPPHLRAEVFVSKTLDLFAGHNADRNPAILLYPSWLGREVQEEIELAFEPGDYKITPGDRWTVIALKTGEQVYSGLGPVQIVLVKA